MSKYSVINSLQLLSHFLGYWHSSDSLLSNLWATINEKATFSGLPSGELVSVNDLSLLSAVKFIGLSVLLLLFNTSYWY